MRWPARMRNQEGFTLVELLIGMVIMTLLIGAMGSALVVSLRTTDATNQRMSENHDVQITSSYLANDVQSAANVSVGNTTTDCSGAFITLVTFTYPAGSPPPDAVYNCGTASNGETQVTRTFAGGSPIVIAHFAGTARPSVSIAYDPFRPTIAVSVTMTFTKASDCTLDCTYTLFGSRRSFNPASTGSGTSTTGDVVLMSTGTTSPLWVQGSCANGGTDPAADCFTDPSTLALPSSDVATTGWTPTPSSPATLWDKLGDKFDGTWISTSSQGTIAKVALPPVNPPGGTNPTVEIRAASAGAAAKLKVHIYDSTTGNQLVASGNINVNSSIDNSGDWLLTNADRALIPDSAYQHLTLGIEMTNPRTVNVYGLALTTAGPGLLTIQGSLYVNSPKNGSDGNYAVRLTGAKTATKLSISPPGTTHGDYFQILQPGTCSGCSSQTVSCPLCNGGWSPKLYTPAIPDPLRSLPDPTVPSTNGGCNATVCTPGRYPTGLSLTSARALQQGIYYLQSSDPSSAALSLSGTATITCAAPCTDGVMLYIASGSVSLTGQSSVNLPAPSSGVYKGIVMFQARTDQNPVKIAGNSGSGTTNVFGGVVYVPNSSQVTLATGSASLTAKAIVAQNIKVSSAVTIG